jgi:murein endopeptidase
VADGPGCDDTLDWWFSDEAKVKEKAIQDDKTPSPMPKLPDACSAVLNDPAI